MTAMGQSINENGSAGTERLVSHDLICHKCRELAQTLYTAPFTSLCYNNNSIKLTFQKNVQLSKIATQAPVCYTAVQHSTKHYSYQYSHCFVTKLSHNQAQT